MNFQTWGSLRIFLVSAVVIAALVLTAFPALGELPPLIPREVLFGNPVKSQPQISPNGKILAYLAPNEIDVFPSASKRLFTHYYFTPKSILLLNRGI